MRLHPWVLAGALLAAGLLTACGIGRRSPETRYYVLDLPAQSATTSETRSVSGPRLGIGPMDLPGYLDRRQILLRQSNAPDVRLAEYDLWGENLAEGAARVLAAGLSARLAGIGGIALPLRPGDPVDLRLDVTINRFDGVPGEDTVLDAGWSLCRPEGSAVRAGQFVARIRTGADIEGLVRAHGALLEQFAEALAGTIRSLPPGDGAVWRKTASLRRPS